MSFIDTTNEIAIYLLLFYTYTSKENANKIIIIY